LIVVVESVAGAASALAGGGRAQPHHHATTTPSPTVTPAPAPASSSEPEAPGSLALAPDGGLYIADATRNEIFERLPDGTFRVVAGDGTAGFSGDGRPATAAEIDAPGAMAVASNGTLYFTANTRVRAVLPTGTITTVVGDGRRGTWVSDGTPALDAHLLGATSITLSPSGELYIATGNQVLALQPNGTLTNVLGHRGPYEGIYGIGGPAVEASADGAAGLAFNAAGDLFVFGSSTKSVLMVTPRGIVSLVPGSIYPRGVGGLVPTPDGAVLAMNTTSIVRLTPQGEQTVMAFPTGPTPPDTYLGVENVAPVGIAVAPNRTIYFDTNPNDGYSNAAVIAAISPDGKGVRLWRRGESVTTSPSQPGQ
ncbi:MAG: NHL repeat-containing protein, partial [Acidimicrobiales bacterium]